MDKYCALSPQKRRGAFSIGRRSRESKGACARIAGRILHRQRDSTDHTSALFLLFACYPDESNSRAKPAFADRRRGTNKEKGRTAQRKYLRRVNAPVFIV